MTITNEPVTAEDLKKIGAKGANPQTFEEVAKQVAQEQAKADEKQDEGLDPNDDEFSPLPEWALPLPPEVVLPKARQIYVMRFRAKLTDTPKLGDRYCILWGLSEADEKLALKRTRGDSSMTMNEMSKQMIRVLGFIRTSADGKERAEGEAPEWTSGASNLNSFWNAIGGKYRPQVKNAYMKMHTMEPGEIVDFFTNCVAVRTVVG